MGDSNVDGDGGEVNGDGGGVDGDAFGALPHPGRVPEQRLLFPKIGLRWRRRCGTFLGKTPTDLGFSLWRLYIGKGAISEDGQGPHTIGWRTLGVTHATRWCGCPLPPPPTLLWTLSRVGGK
jgi:hypothetical protein